LNSRRRVNSTVGALAMILKFRFSIVILLALAAPVMRAQTPRPQPSPTPNPETLDWCKAEPAYDAMLRDANWKYANDLYQIVLVIKTRVTPEQRANIRTILFSMVDGPRKPDSESLNAVTSDFVEGALLRKLTTKQKAELAIQMQFAMQGVNEDLLSNVNTSVASINRIFNEAGMNAKRARKIVDDIYALVAKARATNLFSTRPNKSLDASGGSVFLNLIRAAMLE
jgi:hypothetical protein